MGVFYEFDSVDGFGVGALGEPGQRVFFIQARQGSLQLDVKCEKQQVAAIAEYLRGVLDDLPTPDPAPIDATITTPGEPIFVLGPVGLGHDKANDRILIQLEELIVDDDDAEDEDEDDESRPSLDRGHLRVFLTPAQAEAFCSVAAAAVAAGRPPCPWCNGPLDPRGHSCPRMN